MLSRKTLCAAATVAVIAAGSVRIGTAEENRAVGTATVETGVAWQTNLRAAHKISVREGKPLLLVFGADWCTFCKKLENETLAHPELAAYVNEGFVPVHLDYDHDKRAREILEVDKLPCTIILTPDADLLDRFEGYQEPAVYYRKLSAAKDLYTRLTRQTSGRNER